MSEQAVASSEGVRRARFALDVGLYAFAASLAAGIAPIQISLSLIAAAALALHLLKAPVLRPSVLAQPLALFLGAVMLVAIGKSGEGASPLAADVRGVLRLGAALLVAGAVRDGRQAFRLAAVFVLACALQGLYGTVQHFTGIDLLHATNKVARHLAPGTKDRWLVFGTYPRHATFAFVGHVALIFVAAGFVAGALRRRAAVIAAIATIPIGFGALFTTLRMIWAGFGAALLAMGAIEARWRRIGVALGAMALALALATAASPALQAKLSRAFDGDYANNSHRGFMWARSLAMLVDHPGGIGAGTFTPRTEVYYTPHSPKFQVRCHSHDNFLFAWVESGPLALVGFIWFFAAALAALRRGIKRLALAADEQETRERRAVILASAGVVVSTLVWSLTHDPLYDGVIVYTLGFALGLGLAAAGPVAEARDEERLALQPPEDGPAWIPAVAAGGICVTALVGAVAPGEVDRGGALAALVALAALGLSFVPRVPPLLAGALRIVGGLGGLALVGWRPFAAALGTGSEAFFRSPEALVAVAALAGAVATAAWSLRRPGEVGTGPVAGALAFAFAAGWPFALSAGGYELLGAWEKLRPTSHDFAVWGCAAALLAAAFTGPLRSGGEVRGAARAAPIGLAIALVAVAVRGLT